MHDLEADVSADSGSVVDSPLLMPQAARGDSRTKPASPSPPSCFVDPPWPLCQTGLALLCLKSPRRACFLTRGHHLRMLHLLSRRW